METPTTAIVLAATDGMRMRPLTQYLPKVLLPIGNRPLIIRHIERLIRYRFNKIIITLEPRLGSMIQCAIEQLCLPATSLSFVWQKKRGGLGYALLLAAEQTSVQEPFVFVFGDEINSSERFYRELNTIEPFDGAIGVRLTDMSRVCATAEVIVDDKSGVARSYREKPTTISDRGIGTSGIYAFDVRYLEVLSRFQFNADAQLGEEFSIGYSIQHCIKSGMRFRCIEEDGHHIHMTNLHDYKNEQSQIHFDDL